MSLRKDCVLLPQGCTWSIAGFWGPRTVPTKNGPLTHKKHHRHERIAFPVIDAANESCALPTQSRPPFPQYTSKRTLSSFRSTGRQLFNSSRETHKQARLAYTRYGRRARTTPRTAADKRLLVLDGSNNTPSSPRDDLRGLSAGCAAFHRTGQLSRGWERAAAKGDGLACTYLRACV